jgi:hypothetical protein
MYNPRESLFDVRKGFGTKQSGIFGPLHAETCGGFLAFGDMILHAFAAVPVSGTFEHLARAILFDFCHERNNGT